MRLGEKGEKVVFPLLHRRVLLCALLSKHDKDMAPTLSVGRQMICMLQPKIFSFAVHRHVGLPDNLLSVEFRFYGAGAGSRHSWTGFPTGRLGGVRLSRVAVGYIHGAFMRRFRPTLPRFPGVVHTVVGMRTCRPRCYRRTERFSVPHHPQEGPCDVFRESP